MFTLLTTNLTPDGIRKRYGDRIADRLNEMAVVIPFKNPSYGTDNVMQVVEWIGQLAVRGNLG